MLHRGVRPANVIVELGVSPITARLVDFGPTRTVQADAPLRDQPLDAALYASPEQAGSIDHDMTGASDLYSAGVLLHECLVGRPPFAGDSVGEILFQHMTTPAPDLSDLGVNAPRALEELLQRLLRKDPRDRYQSAAAALADWDAIDQAVRSGQSDPAIVIGAHDQRTTLTEPAFVARSKEMAQLDDEIGKAQLGRGGLSLLEGESGGGKTRLLAETARRAARAGLCVLRGQGTSEVAQRPFIVLDGVVESFLSAVRADPQARIRCGAARARIASRSSPRCRR